MSLPAPPSYPGNLKPAAAIRGGFPFLVTRYARAVAVPVNVWDYERLAEERLDGNAYAYFVGGSGDEVTLRDNLAAFERRKLRPRVLVDVSSVTRTQAALSKAGAVVRLLAARLGSVEETIEADATFETMPSEGDVAWVLTRSWVALES